MSNSEDRLKVLDGIASNISKKYGNKVVIFKKDDEEIHIERWKINMRALDKGVRMHHYGVRFLTPFIF